MNGYGSHVELTDNANTIMNKYEKHVKITIAKVTTVTNSDATKILQNVTISFTDFGQD